MGFTPISRRMAENAASRLSASISPLWRCPSLERYVYVKRTGYFFWFGGGMRIGFVGPRSLSAFTCSHIAF